MSTLVHHRAVPCATSTSRKDSDRYLRLVVDGRVWRTGLGTYTWNLLPAIRRIDRGVRIKALVRAEAVNAISDLCDEVRVVDVPIYSLREQVRISRAARGCDLLHVPHYNVPLLFRGPLVVTIHDLTHLTDRTHRNRPKTWGYAWPMLKIAARKASQVITVSHYSRRQIVERLGIRPDKIRVIYNGVGAQFHPADREIAAKALKDSLQIDSPYLLFVGNLKPHKNLGTLLRAFALLRSRKRVEHALVLLGDDRKGRQAVLGECRSLGISDAVRHIPWAAEEMMPQLYAAADLLVMPSTSEGFGLPVLEAMACGTPVACSNATSLPEVGGDASAYFNPRSVEDMADAIEKVVASGSLQAELREKGLRQAAKFTWEECARKHLEVYRHVLTC